MKNTWIESHQATKENDITSLADISVSEHSSSNTLNKSYQSANIPYHSKQRKI